MERKYAVVHDLRKELGGQVALNLRQELINNSVALDDLFTGLHTQYHRKATKGFGQFSNDVVNYPFSSKLDDFLNTDEDASFLLFTHISMEILKEHISREYLATGGYVLFILFVENGKRNLFVTLVRQRRGCVITQDLDIDTANHLEIDKLHTGCLIEIDTWKSNPETQYVTFIKGRTTPNTPQYFLRAIGCTEFANSAQQTDELVRAVNEFAKSKSFTHEQRQQLRQTVYDHCKDKDNIQLDSLSQAISDTDPDEFLEFINTKGFKIGNGFEPKSKNLKKLREIKASGEGIQLKFPSEMLGNRIKLDPARKTITIQNAPESIIKALRDD